MNSKPKQFFQNRKFKILASLLFSLEALLALILMPSFIPEKTDVVGGFILFEYQNLKFLGWWIFLVAILFPSIPLQIRLIDKFAAAENGNQDKQNFRNSNQEEINSNREFIQKITAGVLASLVIAKFSMTSASLFYSNLQINHLAGRIPVDVFPWISQTAVMSLIYLFVFKKIRTDQISFFVKISLIIPPLVVMSIQSAIIRAQRKLDLESNIFTTYFFGTAMLLILSLITLWLIDRSRYSSESFVYCYAFAATLVLFTARIPEKLAGTNLHAFESYSFANVNLWREYNYSPWTDLLFNHGIYEDFLRPLAGSSFFGFSVWGMQAGITSIVFPLEVAFAYICVWRILKGNLVVPVVVATFGLLKGIFPALLPSDDNQFLVPQVMLPRLLPLLLFVACFQLRDAKIRFRMFGLALSLATLLIFAPEGIYIVIAYIAASLILDIAGVSKQGGLARIRTTIIWKSAFVESVIVILAAISFLLLLLNFFGLAEAFISQFLLNSSGYLFQGGGPIALGLGLPFIITIGLCVFLISNHVIKTFGLISERRIPDRSSIANLIVVLVGAIYFCKFILWPDWHILQVFAALTVPLMIYVSKYFGISSRQAIDYEDNDGQLIKRNPQLISVLLTIPLAFLLLNANNAIQRTGGLLPTITDTQLQGRLGLVDKELEARQHHLQQLAIKVKKYSAKPSPTVLDMTNSPTDVYAIAGLRSVPNLLFTATAFSSSSQLTYIQSMKRDLPDVVLWRGEAGYFEGALPGATYLRQYRFSQFVLENYRAVATHGGYIILIQKEVRSAPIKLDENKATTALNAESCNWEKSLPHLIYPNNHSSTERKLMPTKAFNINFHARTQTIESILFLDKDDNKIINLISSSLIPESKVNSLLVTEKFWSKVVRLVINGIPVNNFRDRNEIFVNNDIFISISTADQSIYSYWTVDVPGNIDGIEFVSPLSQGNYMIKAVDSIGISSFALENHRNRNIRMPMSSCPSLRVPNRGFESIELLIRKPKDDTSELIKVLLHNPISK